MAQSKLKIDVRRNAILDLLRLSGSCSVSELSEQLAVTPVTIRNDLDTLEQDGYLTRTRGGAAFVHQFQRSAHEEEAEEFYAEKQALAAQVAELVQDGQTLFFNSGTTTRHIARALQGKKYLQIVTNSLAVAMELGQTPTFHVLLLGGELDARYGFTCGGDAQEQLGKYQADWAILSVDGVSAAGGLTTYHPGEAIIDRMMIANARQSLVAATANKIGRAGFSRICECGSHLTLVTSRQCSQEAIELLNEQDVHIYQV